MSRASNAMLHALGMVASLFLGAVTITAMAFNFVTADAALVELLVEEARECCRAVLNATSRAMGCSDSPHAQLVSRYMSETKVLEPELSGKTTRRASSESSVQCTHNFMTKRKCSKGES